ncbi:MAG TPA: DNA primase [Bacteroidales bacterium]|nr:DNA primase [Bacteroidales bacterium]MDI9574712.1 DNA primase [Bacteroidota bacterium]OQC60755.1 MAG: DNA primase [Bacteroidetes bacterium ADurb.Bin012]NMD16080.1 DNA primase [Bacteroidales bacterium]HNQ59854.1 DNA primase [Bacteroidales bacterium]
MIPESTVSLILETARIEEVIGEYVHLRRRGANLVGLCPFHSEKTPSFTVSPLKGFYKCFGCGAAGNVVKFLMEYEHYTYIEALRYLARKYNIEIEEREPTEEEIQKANEKESLYSVNAMAAEFFKTQLWETPEGRNIGLSYFEERGFQHPIIQRFQLGYSPMQKDALYIYALSKGFDPDYIEKAGLIIKHGNEYIDRFFNRVIFPIHNQSGRIIGFGGRILTNDKLFPKYINTPETEIYHKSNVLYGFYQARKQIADANNCYLVEGYTDVISMNQIGVSNVVASSGTSLTPGQIHLIKRYTPNVTILYDGDTAGIKASFRGIDMILQEGMNVRIVLFPKDHDPDSFARSHRTEEVVSFITEKAQHFIGFKTNVLLDETQNDPIKRSALIKEILDSIALVPSSIARSEFIKYTSETLNIPEQTLLYELNKILSRKYKNFKPEPQPLSPPNLQIDSNQEIAEERNITHQEYNIIRLLLNHGEKNFEFQFDDESGQQQFMKVNTSHFIVSELIEDDYEFSSPVLQKLYQEYKAAFEKNIILPEKYFINHPDEEIANIAMNFLASNYQISENWFKQKGIFTPKEIDKLKDLVINSVYNLRLRRIELEINKVQQELQRADWEEAWNLLKQLNDLNVSKSQISKKLGRIILK